MNFKWDLDKKAGTVAPKEGNLKPTHSPPDKPGSGILELRLKDHHACNDKKEIVIFKDHLERDVANFQNGKKCAGSVGGVQLADKSQVIGLSLTCGPSFLHAHEGNTEGWSSSTELFNSLAADKKNWKHKTYEKEPGWKNFEKVDLPRGSKVMLMPTGVSSGHPATVYREGTGASAMTYAGDSTSKIFRHELVDTYFVEVLKLEKKNRKVRVLTPKK